MGLVQQYHRLNRSRMDKSTTHNKLNDIFRDVAIYVSVQMRDIEKTTPTTKETVSIQSILVMLNSFESSSTMVHTSPT